VQPLTLIQQMPDLLSVERVAANEQWLHNALYKRRISTHRYTFYTLVRVDPHDGRRRLIGLGSRVSMPIGIGNRTACGLESIDGDVCDLHVRSLVSP